MKRAGASAVALTIALVALSACGGASGSSGSSKAGGDPVPVTFRIGTDDAQGRPAAEAIEEFARQVQAISGGQLLIEPAWQAAGSARDDWDQAVARLVVSGELDMGMIPARAWDTEGVMSLRALHAPFLVTSEAHVEQVVTANLAEEMLSGLDEAGVTGLALVPEGLRQVFAFGAPLLSPGDFEGVTVRAPRSDTTAALFEAMGAAVDDLPGDLFAAGVEAGTVAAAESSFALATSLPRATTVTGNLTLFPKVNSLVINSAAFAALDEAQQQVLREAATLTRDWGIRSMTPAAEAAAEYCTNGGTIVTATEEDLAAFARAAEPVYADLEKDVQTRALIDQIRDLAPPAITAEPIAACGPPTAAPTSPPPSSQAAFPDGQYRTEHSEQALLQAGLDADDAAGYAGTWTLTFENGEVTIDQRGYPTDTGAYCVATRRITVAIRQSVCAETGNGIVLFSAEWSLDDGQLLFTAVRPEEEGPLFATLHEALWGSQPWQKIG